MPAILFQTVYQLNNINETVVSFWHIARNYQLLAFSGEMGAGKTTFIHALCEYLGVTDTVSSPTFALINEYHFIENNKDHTIYHTDWYRLKDATEAINAGMEDCILQTTQDSGIYCFIEWPEKAPELLLQRHIQIHIETINETERKITVSPEG